MIKKIVTMLTAFCFLLTCFPLRANAFVDEELLPDSSDDIEETTYPTSAMIKTGWTTLSDVEGHVTDNVINPALTILVYRAGRPSSRIETNPKETTTKQEPEEQYNEEDRAVDRIVNDLIGNPHVTKKNPDGTFYSDWLTPDENNMLNEIVQDPFFLVINNRKDTLANVCRIRTRLDTVAKVLNHTEGHMNKLGITEEDQPFFRKFFFNEVKNELDPFAKIFLKKDRLEGDDDVTKFAKFLYVPNTYLANDRTLTHNIIDWFKEDTFLHSNEYPRVVKRIIKQNNLPKGLIPFIDEYLLGEGGRKQENWGNIIVQRYNGIDHFNNYVRDTINNKDSFLRNAITRYNNDIASKKTIALSVIKSQAYEWSIKKGLTDKQAHVFEEQTLDFYTNRVKDDLKEAVFSDPHSLPDNHFEYISKHWQEKVKDAENAKKAEEASEAKERLLAQEIKMRRRAAKLGYSQENTEKLVALVRKHNGYRTSEYLKEVREIQLQDIAAREERLLKDEAVVRERAIKDGFSERRTAELVSLVRKHNGINPEFEKAAAELHAKRTEEGEAENRKIAADKKYSPEETERFVALSHKYKGDVNEKYLEELKDIQKAKLIRQTAETLSNDYKVLRNCYYNMAIGKGYTEEVANQLADQKLEEVKSKSREDFEKERMATVKTGFLLDMGKKGYSPENIKRMLDALDKNNGRDTAEFVEEYKKIRKDHDQEMSKKAEAAARKLKEAQKERKADLQTLEDRLLTIATEEAGTYYLDEKTREQIKEEIDTIKNPKNSYSSTYIKKRIEHLDNFIKSKQEEWYPEQKPSENPLMELRAINLRAQKEKRALSPRETRRWLYICNNLTPVQLKAYHLHRYEDTRLEAIVKSLTKFRREEKLHHFLKDVIPKDDIDELRELHSYFQDPESRAEFERALGKEATDAWSQKAEDWVNMLDAQDEYHRAYGNAW
jgi:hypothetical protein